jgi:hypothetical protein
MGLDMPFDKAAIGENACNVSCPPLDPASEGR